MNTPLFPRLPNKLPRGNRALGKGAVSSPELSELLARKEAIRLVDGRKDLCVYRVCVMCVSRARLGENFGVLRGVRN